MSMKLPTKLQRQLLDKGIVGPPTIVHRETISKAGFAAAVLGCKLVVQIYMKLPSMSNLRGSHWAAKAKIVKKQRKAVADALFGLMAPPMPVRVTFTRIAPRTLDSDNLTSAFKGFRDAVAEWIGVDDGSDQYQWHYEQLKGTVPFVQIEIESKEAK